jgi:hypothetical protein
MKDNLRFEKALDMGKLKKMAGGTSGPANRTLGFANLVRPIPYKMRRRVAKRPLARYHKGVLQQDVIFPNGGDEIKREFRSASSPQEISNLVDAARDACNYSAVSAIIDVLKQDGAMEKIALPGKLPAHKTELGTQCAEAIGWIVRNGHTPLSGEMVDALIEAARNSSSASLKIGVFISVFGELRERRAVDALLEFARGYVPNPKMAGELSLAFKEEGLSLDVPECSGEISLAMEAIVRRQKDVAAAAVLALRMIGDSRALEVLRELERHAQQEETEGGFAGVDLYLGAAIRGVENAECCYEAMERICRMDSELSDAGRSLRKNVESSLPDGISINWQKMRIWERNLVLYAIECIYSWFE